MEKIIDMIPNILNAIFCGGIFIMGVLRIMKMDSNTKWAVRWSICMQTAASLLLGSAPFFPDGPVIPYAITAFTGAQFAMLASMGGLWRSGPPVELLVDPTLSGKYIMILDRRKKPE